MTQVTSEDAFELPLPMRELTSNATFPLNSHFVPHSEVRQTTLRNALGLRGSFRLNTGYMPKRERTMANNVEMKNEVRKAWAAPELRRLRAGAAEAGGGETVPDGGDPNVSDRS